jgi:Arylsulfotransferase (ASST)
MHTTPLARWPLLSLSTLVLAVGCQASATGAETGEAAGADDVVSAPEVGTSDCSAGDSQFTSLEIVPTNVATVPAVTWSSTEAMSVFVRFVGADGIERETNVSPSSTEGTVTLRGLHSKEDYSAIVVTDIDGERYCSSPMTGQTDALSSSLPVLSMDGDEIGDYTTTPMFTLDGSQVTVMDGLGEVVFHWESTVQVWRSRFTADGDALLVNNHPTGVGQPGAIRRVEWDGTITTIVEAIDLHTDFVELPNGHVAGLVWEARDFIDSDGEVRSMLGDKLVEYDTNGEPTVLWNVFDHFTPNLDIDWPIGEGAVSKESEDWSHANGLSYDAERDVYYVSLPGVQSVVAVDRQSQQQIWSVGYTNTDIATNSPETILNPHSVYRTDDDEIVVFNRNNPSGGCSAAQYIGLDLEANTATERTEYSGDQCLTVTYLGEAQPTSDGGMLMVWTTAGKLERLDSEGARTWGVSGQLGAAFGFSHVAADLYPQD